MDPAVHSEVHVIIVQTSIFHIFFFSCVTCGWGRRLSIPGRALLNTRDTG